jgi:hypothetical protein
VALLYPDWPDGVLSLEAAQQLVTAFGDGFNDVWDGAWSDWIGESEKTRGIMRPSTRSGMIHDFAVARAKEVFRGVKGVEICEKLGFFKMYIVGKAGIALVRLKHLSSDHLAKNIKTEQQRSYYWHRPIAGLHNEATRLSIGYVLAKAQTVLGDVVVSLQWGLEDLIYSFSIRGDAIATPLPVVTVPPPTTPPVRAKGAKREKGNEGS